MKSKKDLLGRNKSIGPPCPFIPLKSRNYEKNKAISEQPLLFRMGPMGKFTFLIIASLLFGFGWQVRGSGTSDPIVVTWLYMILIGYVLAPRENWNLVYIGIFVTAFRLMRRGWGTFVGQSGIPGIWPGRLISWTEGYDVPVAWWQGYFWLFLVGAAWSAMPMVLLGTSLSRKKYTLFDALVIIGIYIGCYFFIANFIAPMVIPTIAPEAYNEVYIALGQERNYISMVDNLSFALAIIGPLTYIAISKKDWFNLQLTVAIMFSFGIGFSVANISQAIGRNTIGHSFPFWSVWEYFSGFIAGGLMTVFLFFISRTQYEDSDKPFTLLYRANKTKGLMEYLFAFLPVLYAIQESTIGMINSTLQQLTGTNPGIETWQSVIVALMIGTPLFILYSWRSARKKPIINYVFLGFTRAWTQARIYLVMTIIFVPFFYMCYAMQFLVTGGIPFTHGYTHSWLNTISVIIVEAWCVIRLIFDSRCKLPRRVVN